MASTTLPRRGTRALSRRWIIAAVVALVLIIGAAIAIVRLRQRTASAPVETTTVASGPIVATVAGSGTIAAARTLELPFQTAGSVTEVLVETGDTVTAGQPLARLDDRSLQLDVANAEVSLQSAQARLAQVESGNATPEDLKAAQASVSSAQANLTKARTGNTTAADIASAEAALRSALAKLDALKNPSPDKISSAALTVTQAQHSLQATRDSASATKTRAELDMQKAVESLKQAQSAYATALQQWQHVQSSGTDPINPTENNAQGRAVDNNLNDAQRQQYYDSYVRAEAAMHSAEQAVEQARVAYDNARQQEVVDVQDAEAKLADAQQQLDALKNPSANDVVQAQAAVDQARASLQKLKQGGTQADVAAAQASVVQAQANLEKLTAPATATDLTIQQAAVAQAEQALKQAQLNLESATLKAPFDGMITAVNVTPGSSASSATAAFSLIDRSTLHVDLALSENDVALVAVGQPVTITIDALEGWKAQATVTYIAPAATTTNGVVTYPIQVSFPDDDGRVKIGMTANVTIVVATKEGVLLVPTSALLPKGSGQVVQVVGADGTTTREVEVQTGLSDGTNTEVTGGLKAGDRVVTAPNTTTSSSSSSRGGPFGP